MLKLVKRFAISFKWDILSSDLEEMDACFCTFLTLATVKSTKINYRLAYSNQ
jgi:hypothetical protein